MLAPSLHEAEAREVERWALWFLVALYIVLQMTHAWMVDDAYITLRTVDNFVHGLGLRWNPDERVQSYTHPLWMFALTAVYALTREEFFSTLALSLFTSMCAIAVVLRTPRCRAELYRPALFMTLLIGSKAFLDYSTSGLENPLTHLLLAAFFTRWLKDPGRDAVREPLVLLTLVSLAFLNRMDTLLFYVPACGLLLYEQRHALRSLLRVALPASIPAVGWVLFSLFYYGQVVPNTAVAKLSGPRVTLAERLQAGLAYVLDSAMTDPLTLLTCGLALAAAVRSRRPRVVAAAGGVFLYVLYVGTTGAIGTHMSGRFFSGPLFLSALLLAELSAHWSLALGAAGVVALWLAASPVSPLLVGFAGYGGPTGARGNGVIIDTRRFVLDEGAALLSVVPGETMPRHWWYRAGLEARRSAKRVFVGAPGEQFAVGYAGFAAGPDHHILDLLGLCDPLMARIPLAEHGAFRPGHFFRTVPDGYAESLERDENRLYDTDLAAYYEVLRSITRGPLFSGERIRLLIAFNLGWHDHLLEAYAQRNGLRLR